MRRAFLMMISLSVSAFAFLPTASAVDGPEAYKFNTYKAADGLKLPYRMLSPKKIVKGKTYPLVLFLHGAGERGTDNDKQLVHGCGEFAKPNNRQKYPCFVVAPQCPDGKRWVEVDWNLPSHTMPEKPSVSLKAALELVEKLAAELPVDKSRIYITGISMGGFGTWDAIQRRPELFAAAIPVCGGGDVAQAPKLKDMPIWAFHGDKDSVVMPRRTKDMVEAIAKAGGSATLSLYPGVDHNSWTATYSNPQVLAWLFEQKKK